MGQSIVWQTAYELERRAVQDRTARRRYHDALYAGKPADNLHQSALAVSYANTQWLKKLVADIGWPTISAVGNIPAHRAWQLAYHADDDLPFQKYCLNLMQTAEKGDVLATDIAYLEDRIAVNAGLSQPYGTQGTMKEEDWQPHPILDPKDIDARRASVGLSSLADHITNMKDAYLNRGSEQSKLFTSLLSVMEIQAEQAGLDISQAVAEIDALIDKEDIASVRFKLSELKQTIQQK